MKTKNRLFLRLVIITFAIAVLVILTFKLTWKAPPNGDPTADRQPISLRLKWLIYSSFAHHFVALDKGLFREQGLDVSISPGGAGLDPIKLVASGADDVGLAGYGQILVAREKGIPVIAIAEEYVKSGVVALSLKDSGINKPTDFVGRTVGIVPGSDPTIVYQALMAKLGIDRSKVNEIPIGFDMTPLFERKIDVTTVAYISNQPIVAEDKGFAVNIIDPAAYGVAVGGNVFFTSEETLLKKRDILKRFLKAEFRAIVESQQMPDDDVVGIVLKYNDKLNRATEHKIWKVTKNILLSHDSQTVGIMPNDTWQATADIFYEQGLLKERPTLSKCYSNELVEEIHNEATKNPK